MNCQGLNNNELQNKLKETFNNKSIIPECCVSYEINWKGERKEDIFCSRNLNQIRCKADIEIFKKTIMSKCISNGVKEFFKNLSEYEFDMEHYLAKASNLNKLKNFRILSFLNELKIISFRNIPHFANIRKYLDLFSKFFDKYFSLMQKESKTFEIDVQRKKSIIDIESKKGKIILSEDDILNKVLDNITSQSTEVISEELKQFLKKSVHNFKNFFNILLDHGKNIDVNLFKILIEKNKDLKDVEFITSVSSNLAKFLEENKKDKDALDEKTKFHLLRALLTPVSHSQKGNYKLKYII